MGGRQMEPVGILAYKKFTTHIITTNLYMHWRQGKWKLAFTLQKLQSKYSLKSSEVQRNHLGSSGMLISEGFRAELPTRWNDLYLPDPALEQKDAVCAQRVNCLWDLYSH